MKTSPADTARPPGKRGRPPKFGRPSQVVALTLPDEVVQGLRKVHSDLAWAIVTLFEHNHQKKPHAREKRSDVELVTIAGRRSLIAVNRNLVKSLPGISIIPLAGDLAFLALDPGHGMSDLELAVIDRLENPPNDVHERNALQVFRAQLRVWRRDDTLRFHTRAVIVVERMGRNGRPKRPAPTRDGEVVEWKKA